MATTQELVKEYDTLVHREIPADLAAERKWVAKYHQAQDRDDQRLEAQMRRMVDLSLKKTNAAVKKANTLHRALTAKGLRVPPVPHPHHPDL